MMRQKVYCIGNAHIDPVWLWTWQEGFSEIKATFRSALDRIYEFDDFVFTCAGASYYQWVEENEPAMFEEIKAQVRLGKWVLAGGMWLQPDCNAPAGESFARHGLYSQKYFFQRFGKLARFGYNVDSFGHHGNLPQIYHKLRMPAYVMMRPQKQEKGDIMNSTFLWEGIDGARLMTFRIPLSYGTSEDGHDLPSRLSLFEEEMRRNDLPMMLFYGVGNHGGGPTRAAIETLHGLQKEYPTLELSSPDEFFDDARAGGKVREVVRGDLQHHAIGCYSANATIKKNNRLAENRLLMAEKFMSVAAVKAGMSYQADRLEKAWQCVLFNQFHDIMGGCSIKEAYDDARDLHGSALSAAGELLNFALQRISWNINTLGDRRLNPSGEAFRFSEYEADCGGFPVVIFNPNPFALTAPVTLSREIRGIADERGVGMPFQNVRATKTTDDRKPEVVSRFLIELPALGYRTVYVKRFSEFPCERSGNLLRANTWFLENRWYRMEFDATNGTVKRLYDKEHDVEFTPGNLGLGRVHEDYPLDTWAHSVDYLGECIGEFGDAELSLLEAGELQATVRVVSHYKSSVLEQRVTMYRDIRDIDVKVRLNWQERYKTLKLCFPLKGEDNRAFYEIPYGTIGKPTNGMEEAGQSFVAVTGEQGGRPLSLTVITEGKTSYSVAGNEARFVAVRSCGFADHYGVRDEFTEIQDIGVMEFGYSLLPEVGEYSPVRAVKRACAINQKPIAIYETFHSGALPLSDSFVSVSNERIVLSVIKQSENGRRTVLRLHEIGGESAETEVRLDYLHGEKIALRFQPFELKTVCVEADGRFRETDLLEDDFLPPDVAPEDSDSMGS